MTRKQIAINSRSTGQFSERKINGRPHIITTMMSIEGDSVMNKLFYPHAEVKKAHLQLDRLPAPADHPVVDGVFISANDPLATNAHNVGAFVSNPHIDGKRVINDLAIDVEIAGRDDRGKEIINRIKSGERIAVSTGLNADLINAKGQHKGRDYNGIINNIEFDHVAILLDEKPAGDNTYTLNHKKAGIIVCEAGTYNELAELIAAAAKEKYSVGDDSWCNVVDVRIYEQKAIIEVNDNGKERMLSIPYRIDEAGAVVFTAEGEQVKRKVIYEPVGAPAAQTINPESDIMDIKKLLAALVSDARNSMTANDVEKLEGMTEEKLTNALHDSVITQDEPEGYAEYLANKDGYDAFMVSKAEARQKLVNEIVTNSDTTADSLATVPDNVLALLAGNMKKEQNFVAQGGVTTNANNPAVEVDYSH